MAYCVVRIRHLFIIIYKTLLIYTTIHPRIWADISTLDFCLQPQGAHSTPGSVLGMLCVLLEREPPGRDPSAHAAPAGTGSGQLIHLQILLFSKVAAIASVEICLIPRGPDSRWEPDAWKLLRVCVMVQGPKETSHSPAITQGKRLGEGRGKRGCEQRILQSTTVSLLCQRRSKP